MTQFIITVVIAFVLMVLVVIGFAIGKLISGRNRLRRGCGMTPNQKKRGEGCSFCGTKEKCPDKNDDPESDNDDSGDRP